MNYYYQNYMNPFQQSINYKLVDSIDMVKSLEVPIGGYGIFPKVDLTEVYMKTWNPNGTTNIVTYKPDSVPETPENVLLNRINELEKKIDAAMAIRPDMATPQPQERTVKNDF